jgi:hypothetical protein
MLSRSFWIVIVFNTSNVSQMIISVFANTDISPYFSTQNGGATWTNFQNLNFADTTVDWSPSGTAYISRLFNLPQPNSIEVQWSLPPNDPPAFTPIAGSTYTVGQSFPDQPWVVTSRVGGTDRIYIGFNDLTGTVIIARDDAGAGTFTAL